MQVIIASCADQVAKIGARYCLETLSQKARPVLGLATGSTPVALYQELIDAHQNKGISFKHCSSFNLDEYVGIPESHPQSYRYFMQQHLFNHIDILAANTIVPDGMCPPQQAAYEYEEQIKAAGGIDLQVLGIGRNGHIGFNEPSSSLVSRTRIKTLTSQTILDNKRFFNTGEFQPTVAITMGIATILESRKILLLATGAAKAQAVMNFIEGPLSASCPASALQMHADTLVVIDNDAAVMLKHKNYYQQVEKQTELLDIHHE